MSDLNNLYINNIYVKEKKGTIQTFRLIPNYERISDFVSSEMMKVPEDERVLRRGDSISYWNFRRKDDVVFDCSAYSLKKENTEGKEDYLLHFMDALKTGADSWFEPEVIRYRYRTGENVFSYRVGMLPYSIQTTENLYILGLLERRQFNSPLLHFSDLTEIAKLFDMSESIHSIDLDEMDKLVEYGIIPESKERMIGYTNSSRVYKNLKKHYK